MERTPSVHSIRTALRRLRLRTLWNTFGKASPATRFRMGVVAFVSLLFWLLVFFVFREGFYFLKLQGLINQAISEFLFRLFFGSLMIMLIFSTGILIFGGLFNASEAAFLIVAPTRSDHVFAFKFQEMLFFSSWGFFLLGSPMMIAYGTVAEAPWIYYVLGVFFFAAFTLIPCSIGAAVCLLVARYLPRKRKHFLILLSLLGAAGAIYVIVALWPKDGTLLTRAWIQSVFSNLQLADLPLAPSRWISKGLLAASFREAEAPLEAAYYLALLASNGLLCYLLASLIWRRGYRAAYDRVNSATTRAVQREASSRLWKAVGIAFRPLPLAHRALVVKDLRTFVRDPMQWSQALIFVGLLVLYLIALGRMDYYSNSPFWRSLLGIFNLSVTGLILSTYTSRFVFPLLSLEAQKFWLLGPAPISRRSILWSKFAYSFGVCLTVTLFLTVIEAISLSLSLFHIAVQFLASVVLSAGLSGIAVGLGARFPNVKDQNPARIAAGFGGTLNLLASIGFLAAVILATSVPSHMLSLTETVAEGRAQIDLGGDLRAAGITIEQFRLWCTIGFGGVLVFGLLATFVPMKIGGDHYARLEV